ncbi:MAG: glutathione S-transferase N-terminal domain-containing protein [Polyangiales bacterium]
MAHSHGEWAHNPLSEKIMELYYSPLSCSLASRIVAYEANLPLTFTEVDPRDKRTADGRDYTSIHALGTVPLLRDGDFTLFESVAILPYLAQKVPAAKLVPTDPREAAQLAQWLGFVATELHKTVYVPLLDKKAPPEVQAYARAKLPLRMGRLARHLEGREFVLDAFGVADAYLVTVLNWSQATGVDLRTWPAVASYFTRLAVRPSVKRALAEELVRYRDQEARHKAA